MTDNYGANHQYPYSGSSSSSLETLVAQALEHSPPSLDDGSAPTLATCSAKAKATTTLATCSAKAKASTTLATCSEKAQATTALATCSATTGPETTPDGKASAAGAASSAKEKDKRTRLLRKGPIAEEDLADGEPARQACMQVPVHEKEST